MTPRIKLSILTISITERFSKLQSLVSNLQGQIDNLRIEDQEEIEILIDLDNRKRTISEKRNNLLSLAQGDFLCFIDDDDEVSSDFISALLAEISKKPEVDCITYDQICFINKEKFEIRFGLGQPITHLSMAGLSKNGNLKRPPYHMCCFRTSIAQKIKFKEVFTSERQSVEDIDWLLRLFPYLNTESKIEKPLHIYKYDEKMSRSKY